MVYDSIKHGAKVVSIARLQHQFCEVVGESYLTFRFSFFDRKLKQLFSNSHVNDMQVFIGRRIGRIEKLFLPLETDFRFWT